MVAISTCNKGNDCVESMLNDDQFFADTADTPREGIEQHKKGECLNSAISKGKILGGKNNGHMKELIKPAVKLPIKHILNTNRLLKI